MIPAILYQTVYLLFLMVITLFVVGRYNNTDKPENPLNSIFVCIILILFIGLRPLSYVFVDTMNYVFFWANTSNYTFDPNATNLLFDNLFGFMATSGFEVTDFFLLISCIYYGGMLVACRKLFPANTLLAFLVCAVAFSTFTYGTNGIKAGAAASLFLVGLAYRKNIVVSVIFVLLSWGFHHSMQLPVAAYVLALFFKNDKWYFYGWSFCLLMAFLHISYFQNLFGSMSDEGGQSYLITNVGDDWGGKMGFRYDFVLYSAVPVAIGYYIKKHKIIIDDLYDFILHVYLVCNGVWMLCMYASFTNRIAYLSWSIMPIVLIYPYFKYKGDVRLLPASRKAIVLGNMFFTLFMYFIYYA